MATKIKILIIDDDKDLHDILKMAFAQSGFQIFSALDAAQGTMMVRQVQPNLVILDMMMPGGGGTAVYNRIRQSIQTMQTPVLICSAMPKDQIEKQISYSANTVIIPKPFLPNEIVAAVKNIIDNN
jgi:DNA-binding response OmpR family regulator